MCLSLGNSHSTFGYLIGGVFQCSFNDNSELYFVNPSRNQISNNNQKSRSQNHSVDNNKKTIRLLLLFFFLVEYKKQVLSGFDRVNRRYLNDLAPIK